MRLTGLAGPALALALVLTAGLVLLLYLLRRRVHREVVPALFLWDALDPARSRALLALRSFRRTLSLLLALSIALALLLALAAPERVARDAGRHIVIMVDRSASMAAADVLPSRLEQAKVRARALVAAMATSDRALIAMLDATATPLSSLTSDRSELYAALDQLTQSDAAGDLVEGAQLALDVLATRANPELVLLSDGNLAHVPAARAELATNTQLALRFEPIGTARRNVAITRFAVRGYPLDQRHQEALVTLENFGSTSEAVALEVRSGDVLLLERALRVPAGRVATEVLRDLPAGAEQLEARIALRAGPDALASDDRALVYLPPRARTRVLMVSRGNRYLEAALLLDDYLEVEERSPDAYRDARGSDVVIFDQTLPREPPSTPALYFGLPTVHAGFYPLAVTGSSERPFFDRVQRAHPLVSGLALGDVNIARAAVVTLAPGDEAVGGSARTPLLVEGDRGGVPFIALPFDLQESDLPLRAALPLLLLRALDRLSGEEPRSGQPAGTAGEPFSMHLPAGAGDPVLVAADGARTPLVRAGDTVRITCDRAGRYHLALAGGPDIAFAVRVPAEQEGAIAPRRDLFRAAPRPLDRASRVPSGRPERTLWPLFALLALALALLEWLTFHRRWTE